MTSNDRIWQIACSLMVRGDMRLDTALATAAGEISAVDRRFNGKQTIQIDPKYNLGRTEEGDFIVIDSTPKSV